MQSTTVVDSLGELNLPDLFFSRSVKSILPALQRVQQATGTIGRNAENEQIGNKYADLENVMRVREQLAAEGIFLMQPPSSSMHGAQLAASVLTLFIHVESGEFVGCRLTMFSAKVDAHALGSGITYARRYALVATLALATGDDDGMGTINTPALSAIASRGNSEQPSGVEAAPRENICAALSIVLENIKALPDDVRASLWEKFEEKESRKFAKPTDLPFLQLLYARAQNAQQTSTQAAAAG
jgi:hypothetical protein